MYDTTCMTHNRFSDFHCFNTNIQVAHTEFIKVVLTNYSQKQSPEVFCNKSVLENVTKYIGKHLCQSLFLNKFAGVRPATFLNKRLWHRWFPVNFAKFRGPHLFLQNTSGDCFCIQPSRVQEIWFKNKLAACKTLV